MCGPVAVMAAGSIVSAIAGIGAAQAQKHAGKANAQIAENNAQLAEQGAKDAAILGAQEQQQSAWRTRAMIGRQKTAIAANGLDMDVGTPLDILGETAMLGGMDRSSIALDAARKAWGMQAEATNHRNRGAQDKWAGKVGSQATILKTIGSTTSSLGGAWGQYKAGKG